MFFSGFFCGFDSCGSISILAQFPTWCRGRESVTTSALGGVATPPRLSRPLSGHSSGFRLLTRAKQFTRSSPYSLRSYAAGGSRSQVNFLTEISRDPASRRSPCPSDKLAQRCGFRLLTRAKQFARSASFSLCSYAAGGSRTLMTLRSSRL